MGRKTKIAVGVGAGLVVLIVFAAIFGESEEDAPQSAQSTVNHAPAVVQAKPTPEPEPTAIPIPAPDVTAVALYQERKDNATRFDLQRKGKRVRITGMVGQVEDGDIRLVVDRESYRVLGSIFIEFIALKDLPAEVQASVDKNQQFTATCKVGEYVLGTMNLEDCTVS